MDLHVIGRKTLLASDGNSVSFSLEKLANMEEQNFFFLFKEFFGVVFRQMFLGLGCCGFFCFLLLWHSGYWNYIFQGFCY